MWNGAATIQRTNSLAAALRIVRLFVRSCICFSVNMPRLVASAKIHSSPTHEQAQRTNTLAHSLPSAAAQCALASPVRPPARLKLHLVVNDPSTNSRARNYYGTQPTGSMELKRQVKLKTSHVKFFLCKIWRANRAPSHRHRLHQLWSSQCCRGNTICKHNNNCIPWFPVNHRVNMTENTATLRYLKAIIERRRRRNREGKLWRRSLQAS